MLSLITLIHVPEGVVVACDTRTTMANGNNVRYKDDTMKIIPFPDKMLIGHVGTANIRKTLTVEAYLKQKRKQYITSTQTKPEQVPLALFDDSMILSQGEGEATEYIVVCLDKMSDSICKVYRIVSQNRGKCMYCDMFGEQYTALNYGLTDIAESMTVSNSIQYYNLSLYEAIKLTRSTVQATIDAYKCRDSQAVGGNVLCYVMSNSQEQFGWYESEKITPDDNADPLLFEKKCEDNMKKLEQLIKTRMQMSEQGKMLPEK